MSTPRTLLIDADDTLWENNIYYERVTAEFVAALAAHGVAAKQAHETIWATEQRNIKLTGYGSQAFCRSLHEAARELGVNDLEPQIAGWEDFIFHHAVELMPGVADTLPRLHAANRLVLVTKGAAAEQLGKLRRSGLDGYFDATEIMFEKNVAAYQALITNHQLPPAATWMIGNSPRSDINPAKAAGLGTVFIPYHTTWQHEIEEINPEGAATLMLDDFAQLADHFGVAATRAGRDPVAGR
jgi:putative hydrolase of the HAD superfamily